KDANLLFRELLGEVLAIEDPLLRAALAEQIFGEITRMQAERDKAAKGGLKAVEWKPLWGKPAIFAGVVLLIFLVLFRGGGRKPDEDNKAEAS
ncbi:MAG: hypothetical protein ACPGVU_04820, partial [Limisphaerales bacterium]